MVFQNQIQYAILFSKTKLCIETDELLRQGFVPLFNSTKKVIKFG